MAESPKTEMLDVSKLTGGGLEVTLVIAVPGQGAKRYPMRAPSMRVGRSDQVDITVKDASVSSKHCDFVKEGGRLYIRDIGSSNGTWINDEKITEAELNDGDVVRLGSAATVQVEMSGAGSSPSRAAALEPEAAPPNSTMMISAGDLDAMRSGALEPPAPPPPPRRRAAPPEPPPAPRRASPPPMRHVEEAAEEDGSGRKKLVIAIAVALVVFVAGGIGVFFVLKGRTRAADLETVANIERDLAVLQQANPCASVQDSVSVLIRLDSSSGVSTPTLPAKPAMRPAYARFVEVQRDKANQYKSIAKSVEQDLARDSTTADTVRARVAKLEQDALKSAAVGVTEALEARLTAGRSFAEAWKKIEGETEKLAELAEGVFVRGNGAEADAFASFRFAKQAPQILGSCKRDHEEARKALEEKLTALKAAAQ
jgi:hypothetical protein